jgi:GTPase SAR1 family protein
VCVMHVFKHPFTCMICGPSGCGKTSFCVRLIANLLESRVRHGIREHLVRWIGYGPGFDSWIPASSIRRLRRRCRFTSLSDTSRDLYPNNTIARFRVRLPRPVELLQGAWEVGLCELAYPTPESELQSIFVYFDLIGP